MKSQQRKSIFRHILSILRFIIPGLIIVGCVFALNQFRLSRYFPITTVRVYGGSHIDKTQVRDELTPLVDHGFFAVKVDYIRERLRAIPWVSDIYVRRSWPDRVEVTVVEKKAVALWNDNTLLSDAGELFTPQPETYPGSLPRLYGPDGKQIVMLQTYQDMNRLLQPLHAKISHLELTPYFAWKITLDNGITMQIGHKDILTRLDHFVKVYPKIVGDRVADVDYIDLRYPNGVAVRWKDAVS
jgi:cell division protein FtsQ